MYILLTNANKINVPLEKKLLSGFPTELRRIHCLYISQIIMSMYLVGKLNVEYMKVVSYVNQTLK